MSIQTAPPSVCHRISRECRMVGYLSLQHFGKIRGSLLLAFDRLRVALLGDSLVDLETGHVEWKGGTLELTPTEVEILRTGYANLMDDQKGPGVPFDLVAGAVELQQVLK